MLFMRIEDPDPLVSSDWEHPGSEGDFTLKYHCGDTGAEH